MKTHTASSRKNTDWGNSPTMVLHTHTTIHIRPSSGLIQAPALSALQSSCTVLHSMRVSVLPYGMQEWNPRVYVSHSRSLISQRRVAGPSAASPGVAVSTHTRGPPYPLLPARFRWSVSDRLEGWRTVRARVNPLSLEVWHSTLRLIQPGVGS
jgi:hypothetical protein